MPPIQQQTSRGGLITALVISIIAAMAILVWAFMENNNKTKSQQALDALKQRYSQVIAESLANADSIGTLRREFSADAEKTRGGSLIDAATSQRKALVRMITGLPEGSEKDALASYEATAKLVADNPAMKKGAVGADLSLVKQVQVLSDALKNEADATAKAQADLAAANVSVQNTLAANKTEADQRDAKVKEAQALATKAQTDAKTAIDEKQKQVDDFAKQKEAAEKQSAEVQANAEKELQTLQAANRKLQGDNDKALQRIALYRQDVKNPIVRQVDATVTQIAPDGICYINLGFGDHIVPGLTFEVYDKLDGVPKLETGTSSMDLPKGKASIEVISIGQNSTQCRIITQKAGVTLGQGDVCANLVYDRNIKPVFYIYGKFDMDQNGVATDQEAEVIKNLIVRWGGKVNDKLTVDVDYTVMGKEPVIPNYSKEEIDGSPIIRQRFEEAQAALKAYEEVRNQAGTLHIPLMNQNRFLYYCGYFDVSKK